MVQTVLNVLQTPNPERNASFVLGGSNTIGQDWISVESWRPWTDFTYKNLSTIFHGPLSASLNYLLNRFVFPIINLALKRTAAASRTLDQFYISPGSWCQGLGVPDWGLVARSRVDGKYHNHLPGDTKLSAKWSPEMQKSQKNSVREQWKLPVSQVNTYAADSGCRYGYIITDDLLVVLRFSKENVGLGSASSRPSRASQPFHQRVASGGTDISSAMDSMSLDSFGAQSFVDNNFLNTEFQAPEYATIPWDAAGKGKLTIKMALFCLCLMAASGVSYIDSNYPPLDSWTQRSENRFLHNTSG
ncbi:hypothetical protein LZ31DRAFT_616197, partial [Colletotrichum somersetense]